MVVTAIHGATLVRLALGLMRLALAETASRNVAHALAIRAVVVMATLVRSAHAAMTLAVVATMARVLANRSAARAVTRHRPKLARSTTGATASNARMTATT